MANPEETNVQNQSMPTGLEGGTYEIIRNRLLQHGKDLRDRLTSLNDARKKVFGAVETKLIGSERITTENNCVPRDMVPIGQLFLFGYNVFIGLRSETNISDVFGTYQWRDGQFHSNGLEIIADPQFEQDFKNLYKYYRTTTFSKFAVIGPHLFMVFQVGKDATDIKTFKWLITDTGLKYVDNRSDHEYVFPAQHEFEFKRVTHDMHCYGAHPHISIEDKLFVETIGGDLTIKIEDNTETGEGIYSEDVENPDQTLDDAEIYYAIVENTILLKIRPYQEEKFRYVVYNSKVQKAVRIDSIEDACVLLPDGHGLIFPKGYYLQTGELKLFKNDMQDMLFEKRVTSPNGEDYLYVFYNRESGTYVLLMYNLITQEVATPIICHGYSIFDDGKLLYFRSDSEPQKHHVIQIWQSPYYGADYQSDAEQDSFIYKIGNKDIVRCMAECTELLNLIRKEDTYANLYIDIAKKSSDICNVYYWLDSAETFELDKPLQEIHKTASSAIDEFEKVVRTKQNTASELSRISSQVNEIIRRVSIEQLTEVDEFVVLLADLRKARGEVVSLKDLRYVDLEVVADLEKTVSENNDSLSAKCVEFLLKPNSLSSYSKKVQVHSDEIQQVTKVSQARELAEKISQTGADLEMLTEIVSNLKIEDATETTAIIDNISLIYSKVNQVKSALKNKMQKLGKVEGQAEFSAQIKLIDQAVTNYLDLCEAPDKCDEYLTKTMVQLETLEARFADFDEFVLELAEKREELYNAFESRKVQLVEKRNRRATTLMTAGERILKGIRNRVSQMSDINEINGYLASDLMIERLHDTVNQLVELGDTVKAEDIQSQLKAIGQDAIRQLKDKQALYEDGDNIIRFGSHKFAVNHQPLELTIVNREGEMYFHLTGTGFFERITDQQFLETKEVWDMEFVSETQAVYRAEYLAKQMLDEYSLLPAAEFELIAFKTVEELLPMVREFVSARYSEGYIKGVHDNDAAKILHELMMMKTQIGLLRYPSYARALGVLCAESLKKCADYKKLCMKISGLGKMQGLFEFHGEEEHYVNELTLLIEKYQPACELFPELTSQVAAEYLFHELTGEAGFVASPQAQALVERMNEYLELRNYSQNYRDALALLNADPVAKFELIRKWIRAFVKSQDDSAGEYIDEAAAIMLSPESQRQHVAGDVVVKIDQLSGNHSLIEDGTYTLSYTDFVTRLADHQQRVVPAFEKYQLKKKQLVETFAEELKLAEFQPRVLTTFVRNKLIDKVYLQLIGDNLAKQMGSAGGDKRTDRQGLLLLISPPGYGKTTLMEYVANRLGLIFMKINGPAIGNHVTSLDPSEAPNAASREEIQKLNLAFEMGDNVMIYLDDIQHCNPEFLQKFISLCDAQRRIEGVYKDKTRTYDLRGKRVAVIMAGNPYTESGEKFKIPDMLSNRADTYNIGDIVGDNYDVFIDSYIENCLTSNPVLSKLANRSQKDVYSIMQLAEDADREHVEFEGNYSADELNEYVSTMKKLYEVRQVVLKVNQQYIKSAGQADEYRTEPPFLLQGSYRNMNRIASKILPVMNEEELWTLIDSTYVQDSQTLTSGAESNILKFYELLNKLDQEQLLRWGEICKTFKRNKLIGGSGDDNVSKIIGQLSAFNAHLEGIKDTIQVAGQSKNAQPAVLANQTGEQFSEVGDSIIAKLGEVVDAVHQAKQIEADTAERHEALTINDNAQTLIAVMEEQFRTIQHWLKPIEKSEEGKQKYIDDLKNRFSTMAKGYNKLVKILDKKSQTEEK